MHVLVLRAESCRFTDTAKDQSELLEGRMPIYSKKNPKKKQMPNVGLMMVIII